ncbi:McrB family protein [Vibrio coralliirubri]|uniref:McrB family protein n=1 Tax=Vibrio coralliirubri TaxID=1516159 RepID=UPI0006329CA6|nr:AAA family ATPase [Vibrio coralliirubri]CDT14640.1 Restriction enzyme LlaI protein (modular protein) [Vibrio coralliirubri]CDT73988.1 Restriction enzyme LlaI protein (modular protein) [Vibrio coralliirubri]
MALSPLDYENFSSGIIAANGFSKFSVDFFGCGSFVQVTNSTGKVHDVSFQAILSALKGIEDHPECQSYISECFTTPSAIEKEEFKEQARFDSYIQGLQSGASYSPMTMLKYFEKPIRVIGKTFFKDERAKVLAAEQTKMLFAVISRFVHVANGLNQMNLIGKSTPAIDEETPLSSQELTNTVQYIEALIAFMKYDSVTYTNNFFAKNKIFYGAPGTGKSYRIHKEECKGAEKVITVFHPETQYNDFVGSLKPKMERGHDGKSIVTYQFRPGPFTNALIKAKSHPSVHVCLVIEEINRAPAAAVFGELFQLLDRDEKGRSTYKIDVVDPDMLDYINYKLRTAGVSELQQLEIPANLSILATMNSSDQAVMPMDAAFKRRWSFQYIEIDFDAESVPKNKFHLSTSDGKYSISWGKFANIINETLIDCHVAEDRLLGPFFLTNEEMVDIETAKDTLNGKLFVYLWDDVLRHLGHNKIFSASYKTFGNLSKAFSEDSAVFNSVIDQKIQDLGEKVEEELQNAVE